MVMKTKLAVILAAAVLAPQGRADDKGGAVKDEDLCKELLRRVEEDQQVRKEFIEWQRRNPKADLKDAKEADAPLPRKMREIDHRNTERMKEIVERHGWPGKSLVGVDGAHAAWLLVQHADLDRPFQKRCLSLLAEAVKMGEAAGVDLAYLTDRVRVGDKQKQVYGTQLRTVDGKLVPEPIEDEADVDRRRKEVGLQPLAEYLRQAEEFMKGKPPGGK
jgi:hypothetical protein